MSNPPGFCWISSDVSGGRNRDGGGNRRVFVGNLAYSNGLSMSQSSESAGWMSFLFFLHQHLHGSSDVPFLGPEKLNLQKNTMVYLRRSQGVTWQELKDHMRHAGDVLLAT